MNQAWKNVKPKDTFFVQQGQLVSDMDKKTLSFLYQPLIGVVAFSLYHLFLTMIQSSDKESREMFHADLLNEMDIDIPTFYQGRSRLEGLGLLRVFEKEEHNSKKFIYRLEAPLSYQTFFQDDVLTLLLLDKVGERRFNGLLEEFNFHKKISDDYHETTRKFIETYQFNGERLLSAPKELSHAKNKTAAVYQPEIKIDSKTFDWEYFLSVVKDLHLKPDYLSGEVKELILLLHQLYGINELEMKESLLPFVDYTKNELELSKLKHSFVKKYHRKEQQESPVSPTNDATERGKRKNTLRQQGFSQGEISVILSSEESAPLSFIQDIKEQKNGFVSNEERWAVENLVRQSGLPGGVINILIHYILVVKNEPTFIAKLANTIANDWAQSSVHSPEAAIEKVKNLVNKTNEASQKRRGQATKKNYYQKKTRTETLPEWADKDVKETPLSEEEIKAFKARLNIFNGTEEGE
ncbi:replication initiation and membrane attachment family protein [Vagococcus elongatus]|uniref:Uncharacterized protein n=1 Tax=Vagococcus elongatus TaxID=180344 RepID=A0A430AXD0_9ENTE|nr:DnaD domain protein [Vagococcus elongatus]RSU12686.1 hypothetical protein CBF29_06035 [Vagococcus elongatus]